MKILEIKNLSKKFGGLTALRRISFDVNKGEIVGVIGPNGAGKTTMFNMISGAMKPSDGKVFFKGQDITGLPMNKVARKGLARTFQSSIVWKEQSVIENTLLAAYLQRKAGTFAWLCHAQSSKSEHQKIMVKAENLLEYMKLSDIRMEIAKNLPHGKLRALGICIALITDPEVLLLDEPVTGMNPVEKAEIVELLKRLHDRGLTIVIIEHDMATVMNLVERIIVLDHGEKIAEGSPESIRNNKEVIEAYLGTGGTE